VIPVSKNRQLERFGIPVTDQTRTKVREFVKTIYTEAKTLKEASRIAKQELKGTRKARLTAAQKVDPAVLWVLCTRGCRRKALLSIYKDDNAFSDYHRSWCCDRCAKRLLNEPEGLEDHLKQELEADRSLLATSATFLTSDPDTNKIVLLGANIVNQESSIFEAPRPPVSRVRRSLLKKRLLIARQNIQRLTLTSPLVIPEMILPDSVVDNIVQAIRQITSPDALAAQLRVAQFDITSTLIPFGHEGVESIYLFIDQELRRSAALQASMPFLIAILISDRQQIPSPTRSRAGPQSSPRRQTVHLIHSPKRINYKSPRKSPSAHKRVLSGPSPTVSPTRKRVREASGRLVRS